MLRLRPRGNIGIMEHIMGTIGIIGVYHIVYVYQILVYCFRVLGPLGF